MAAPRAEIPIVVLSEASPTSPVAGATAYIKDRATSSLVNIYADSGTTNNVVTQPLTTDSAGRLNGWLPRGAYNVEITVSGKVPYTEPLDISPGSDGGIDTAWLATSAVTSTKLGPESVESSKIKESAVVASKLGPESVETSKVKNLGVTTAKLAELGVTTSKVGEEAITAPKLAALAVSTPKLAELSVSTPKLAELAVTELKVGDGAITSRKFKPSVFVVGQTVNQVNLVSGNYSDITGAELKITPSVASKLKVTAFFDLESNFQCFGAISLDGVDQTTYVARMGPTVETYERHTVGQVWLLSLTVAAHTIKMRAKGPNGIAHIEGTQMLCELVAS